jgi:hypothetical protein
MFSVGQSPAGGAHAKVFQLGAVTATNTSAESPIPYAKRQRTEASFISPFALPQTPNICASNLGLIDDEDALQYFHKFLGSGSSEEATFPNDEKLQEIRKAANAGMSQTMGSFAASMSVAPLLIPAPVRQHTFCRD